MEKGIMGHWRKGVIVVGGVERRIYQVKEGNIGEGAWGVAERNGWKKIGGGRVR